MNPPEQLSAHRIKASWQRDNWTTQLQACSIAWREQIFKILGDRWAVRELNVLPVKVFEYTSRQWVIGMKVEVMITKHEHSSWKIMACASLGAEQPLKTVLPCEVPSFSITLQLVRSNQKCAKTLFCSVWHAALWEDSLHPGAGVQHLSFDPSIPGVSALRFAQTFHPHPTQKL